MPAVGVLPQVETVARHSLDHRSDLLDGAVERDRPRGRLHMVCTDRTDLELQEGEPVSIAAKEQLFKPAHEQFRAVVSIQLEVCPS